MTAIHRGGFLRRFRLKSLVTVGVTVVVMFVVPLFISLSTPFISLSTPWSYWPTFNVTTAAFLTFFTLTIFVRLLFIQPRAGTLLLDAGPYPQRRLFIFVASAWLIAAVLNLDFSQGIRAFTESQALNLSLAVFYILLSFGRLQVHQKGIWLYYGSLPWHKIKSYRWHKGTLYFEAKGIQFWTQNSCMVPEEHVEAFEAYLLEHNIPESTSESVAAA